MAGQDSSIGTSAGGDNTHQVVADGPNDGASFRDELLRCFMAKGGRRTSDGQVERTSATTSAAESTGTKSPYQHARKAAVAAAELKDLLSKQLPDTAKVDDGSGEKTVTQLRAQLQKTIRDEFTTGIGQADALKQDGGDDSIAAALTKFRQDPNGDAKRQALAKEFNLDPTTLSLPDLKGLQQRQGLTPQQKQDAQTLAQLESQYEELNQLRISPSVMRLQYADVLSSGMLNSDAAGATKGSVPLSDAMDAFKLVHEAGSLDKTGDVRNTQDYQTLLGITNNEYGQSQSQRVVEMLASAKQATELEGKGDIKGAEESQKKAVQLADKVDLSYFINNLGNQKDVEIKKQMMSTIVGVETTRENYAAFLLRQGRPSEALPLLSKIQGQVPQLYQNDNNFNQLMNWALSGQKTEGDSPYAHLNELQDAMSKKDYSAAFKAAGDAQTALTSMDLATVQKDADALKQQQADLQKQKDALDKDTTLAADDKGRQQALLQQQIAVNGNLLKMEQDKLNLPGHIKYLQGYTAYLQGDNDGAHGFFEQFKKDYPDLASQKEYNLDAALKATEHQGWLRRNAYWVAPVAGFAAALGAAALTIWTGPGSLAAASAAWLGTAAAIGVATGTAAYVGTTALSGQEITGKTVLQGAGWATLGASALVAAPLAAELGVTLGVLPTADAVATTVGGKIAMGAIVGGIVSVPHAAIDFATNVGYNGDSFGSGLWKFTKESGMGIASGGLAGRFGIGLKATAAWATGPELLTPGVEGVTQQYHDIRQHFHGPLDPVNDRIPIAQRNDALPGEYTVPEIRVVRPQEQEPQDQNQPADQ